MLGSVLSNPEMMHKALGGLGYAAGLAQEDVTILNQTKIPLWAVVGASVFLGVLGSMYVVRNAPESWVQGLREWGK